ncbi:cytidyltransferase [Thermoplasmatales archaeon ex4572_165]|nr:MAG: cytidyltransferase [Thermoplasmatales archaeon ex4572_165]RLF58522.1 MAG: cytidyltransferase [Thermoplasmata archaeon]
MMHVCVGGTFNFFHKGHELLLKTAVEQAGNKGHIFIGIASGDLVKKKQKLRPIEERKNDVKLFLSTLEIKPIIEIQAITDMFGPTLKKDFDVIVVSPETKKSAEYINQTREKRGLKTIHIVEIPFIFAEDGSPIQSRRIIAGEIDRCGNIKTKR